MVFRYDCSTNERAPLRLESSNFRKLVRSGVLLALIAMFRQARAGETLTGLGTLVPSGVIFSAKQTEQIKQTHRFIPISSPFWTPTDKDVALIQSKLPFYLKNWSPTAEAISELEPGLDKAEFDRKSKEIAKNLKSYRLQYLGYSVADRRMIMINGFCEEYWRKRDPSWSAHFVGTDDGGQCFFNVVFDVSRSQFEHLWINSGGG